MQRVEALNLLSKFDEAEDLDFMECDSCFKAMQKIVKEYPEYAEYVLSAVAYSSSKKYFCSDLLPTAMRAYIGACEKADDATVAKYWNSLYKENPAFAMRITYALLEKKPFMLDTVFERALSDCAKQEHNTLFPFRKAAVDAIKFADQEDKAASMIDKAMQEPQLVSALYQTFDKIYQAHPECGKQILGLLEKHLTSERYDSYYTNLSSMIRMNAEKGDNDAYIESFHDKELVEKALLMMESHIADDENDARALGMAYDAAGYIAADFPKYKQRMEDFVKLGLKHKNNNSVTAKKAYRAVGYYDQLCSTVSMHQRGAVSDEMPYGIKKIENPELKQPCVLVIGGDGVISERALNGYMGDIYRLLEEHHLEDKVNVYGVVYDFGDYMNVNYSRTHLMEAHHHDVHVDKELSEETINPKYIKDVYRNFLAPRLADKDGKRLNMQQAAENIRKIQIVAHCHGAYTALKLEEKMQEEMQKLGYAQDESDYIQKQLLVVAQSPYCPLGDSKSTFVSFASARDLETEHYNNFERALAAVRAKEKIPLCYFAGNKGNLFLTDTMGKETDEHNFWGFHDKNSTDEQGRELISLERNVLINGIKNALQPYKGIPDTGSLAVDDEASRLLFEQAEKNGNKLYDKMYAIAMAVAQYRALHQGKE